MNSLFCPATKEGGKERESPGGHFILNLNLASSSSSPRLFFGGQGESHIGDILGYPGLLYIYPQHGVFFGQEEETREKKQGVTSRTA